MKVWVEKAVRTPLGMGVCDSKGTVTSWNKYESRI